MQHQESSKILEKLDIWCGTKYVTNHCMHFESNDDVDNAMIGANKEREISD